MDPGWVITSKKCRHRLNCWFQMGEHKKCFYVFKKDHNQTKQALVRIIACLSFNFLKLTEIAAQLRVLTDTLQKNKTITLYIFFLVFLPYRYFLQWVLGTCFILCSWCSLVRSTSLIWSLQ